MSNVAQIVKEHGCIKCFESNKGYFVTSSGHKVCKECGGTVLTTQELCDAIADKNSEIRHLRDEYGVGGWVD